MYEVSRMISSKGSLVLILKAVNIYKSSPKPWPAKIILLACPASSNWLITARIFVVISYAEIVSVIPNLKNLKASMFWVSDPVQTLEVFMRVSRFVPWFLLQLRRGRVSSIEKPTWLLRCSWKAWIISSPPSKSMDTNVTLFQELAEGTRMSGASSLIHILPAKPQKRIKVSKRIFWEFFTLMLNHLVQWILGLVSIVILEMFVDVGARKQMIGLYVQAESSWFRKQSIQSPSRFEC